MYKLRELERTDMPTVNRWRNDPELIAWLGAPFRYINSDVDDAWYDNYLRSRGNTVRCAIVDETDEGKILGLVSLTGIDTVHRSAELHIMIGDKEQRGKGMGIFAVKSILEHGFYNLNLNRIEVEVLESNVPAQKLYSKAGYVKEGVKRQACYKGGKYINIVIMGVLKDEYVK